MTSAHVEFLRLLAQREAHRHRARLAALFQGASDCVIGGFRLADETFVKELSTQTLYLLLAENDPARAGRLPASPDAKNQIRSLAQLRDGLAERQAMIRTLPNHHAKYWCKGFDDDATPLGVLFSGDLTPSSLDPEDPAGNSHEFLLELDAAESAELAKYIRWMMGNRPATDILPRKDLHHAGGLAKCPRFEHLLLTQPSKTLAQAILDLIKGAERSIVLSMWAMSVDTAVFTALKQATSHKRVLLLIHDDSANRTAIDELQSAGAEVRLCPKMHAKLWLADREHRPHAIVSSANLLRDGMEAGYELGVRLDGDDARMPAVLNFFDSRWEFAIKPTPPRPSSARAVTSLGELSKVVRVEPPLRIF